MAHPAEPALDIGALQRALAQRLSGLALDVHYHESCPSTNSECMRIGRHGAVVVAEHQTAGRGRRGNQWHSPLAQNIYCSLGVSKRMPARYLGLVSLQVGVCVAGVLQGQGVDEVALKWPNDVLLRGRKLGGILIETRALADDEFFLVVGFGLNTTSDPSVLQHIDRPVISLAEIGGAAVDRQALLVELVSEIYAAIDRLAVDNFNALLTQFSRFDALFGRPVQVLTRDTVVPGQYVGLDETGQIQIETENGMRMFAAAEISLRPDHAADR